MNNKAYQQALLNMVAQVVPTFGRVFVCMNSSDTDEENYQRMQETFAPVDGQPRFYTSLATAEGVMESNNNDVCLLDANSTHTVTEMLTVSENRKHFIGMDGGGRLMSPRAKIQMGVTGVATDLAPILDTGVGNSYRNLKVINASTTDESLYGFIANGEATEIENLHTIKTTGLNDANHASFWLASDSATIKNLVVGQSNTPNTAAGFGILIDGKAGGSAGGVVKENILENVYVNMSVGGSVQATSAFIKIADTAALNFGNFINGLTCGNFIPVGGTIMTDAILAPASIVSGSLFITDAAFFGSTGVINNSSAGVQIALRSAAAVANGGLAANLSD